MSWWIRAAATCRALRRVRISSCGPAGSCGGIPCGTMLSGGRGIASRDLGGEGGPAGGGGLLCKWGGGDAVGGGTPRKDFRLHPPPRRDRPYAAATPYRP